MKIEIKESVSAEMFTVTPELRWKVDGYKYKGEAFGIIQKEDVLVLQQKWQGEYGSIKWENVPIVKEGDQ